MQAAIMSKEVVIKIPERDYKVMSEIARKKRMSLERYCSTSATASLTADVDELYGRHSPAYKRLMKKLGIKGF